MDNSNDDLYCIDTSALIHTWTRDYPPDVFRSVWENIENLADQGHLIAPSEVLLELERGGDDLFDWAKARESMFIDPNPSAQEVVRRVVNDYPTFTPSESRDGIWADPYVIALAVHEGGILVTGEKPVGPGARTPKIPNICSDLGVQHTDMLGLIRAQGWHF